TQGTGHTLQRGRNKLEPPDQSPQNTQWQNTCHQRAAQPAALGDKNPVLGMSMVLCGLLLAASGAWTLPAARY
ncbi:hypothetical protein, partial [Gemmiger formicilis]|uniref:hypothetical protein n=1 Tax=Gemmiger formicilis TaxID=745368 RepID=UPI00195845E8